uniref:Uncharacterized protein n=1 Tax=Lepeophtheirus salmonis TaxID=72036 RepID=A0A0K2VGY7_LEPSM
MYTTKQIPLEKLVPKTEINKINWRDNGNKCSLPGNTDVKIHLSKEIKRNWDLNKINNVLNYNETTHPAIAMLKRCPQLS